MVKLSTLWCIDPLRIDPKLHAQARKVFCSCACYRIEYFVFVKLEVLLVQEVCADRYRKLVPMFELCSIYCVEPRESEPASQVFLEAVGGRMCPPLSF